MSNDEKINKMLKDSEDLYLVDFWVDGYDDDKERQEAQEEIIYDQLNGTATSVTVVKYDHSPIVSKARAEVLEEIISMLEDIPLIANAMSKDSSYGAVDALPYDYVMNLLKTKLSEGNNG